MKAYRMSLFCRAFPILDALRPELSSTHYSNSERAAYQIIAKPKQVPSRENALFDQAFPNCDAMRHEFKWTLVLPSEEELRAELMREQRLLDNEKEPGKARRGILECGDMSPLSDAATCRGEEKRGRVRALQRKGNAR